jgi:hypothetical protein
MTVTLTVTPANAREHTTQRIHGTPLFAGVF